MGCRGNSLARQHERVGDRQPVPDRREDRRVIVRGARVGDASPEHCAWLGTGGDEDRRDVDAEAVEAETLRPRVARLVWRDGIGGRQDVIVAATVLVVGDDQENLAPLWRLAHGLPDRKEEFLSRGDIVRRMFVVRVVQEAWFDEAISSVDPEFAG